MSLAPISAWPVRRLLAQGRDVTLKTETLLDNKENTCNLVFEDNKENQRKTAPKQKEAPPALSLPQSALAAVPLACGTLSGTPDFGAFPRADPLDTILVLHKKDSEDSDEVTSEPLIGQAEYSVGDKVEYQSGTHEQWMATKVTRLNFDCRGILASYDLDVKRKALPGKIRWPVLCPSASTVPVPTKLAASVSLAPDWNDLPPDDISQDAARALKPFKVGDTVEYWSSSHSQWMNGRVEGASDDHLTYNLDIKRGANRRKMRSCAEDFSRLQKMHVHVIALTSGASP